LSICQPKITDKAVIKAQVNNFPAKNGFTESFPEITLFTCIATDKPVNPTEKVAV
jgi:hypothetical protein